MAGEDFSNADVSVNHIDKSGIPSYLMEFQV